MKRLVVLNMLGALACAACSSEGGGTPPSNLGDHNVVQGGAQDFARFRAIVAEGKVPAPKTLDEVGFFAEHALDLPPADCGEELCVHPFLAIAPRFDGGNWTMAFLAINSAIDPAALPRPPLHVVIAYEQGLEFRLDAVIEAMSSKLREGDQLSLIVYDSIAEVIARRFAPGDDAWRRDISGASATNPSIYEALQAAARVADEEPGAARIVLITSGRSTAGITDPSRIVAHAASIAERGVGISVIGYGASFDERLPLAIGELGAGTYAYAQSESDLITLAELESETMLYPLATSFSLSVRAAPGYRIGRIYGASRARVIETDIGHEALLEAPALFLGHRTGSSDIDKGRRGGGGGLFVELIAERDSPVGPLAPAALINGQYRAGNEGATRRIDRELINPLRPGQNPAGNWPLFSDNARGKAFMMLNMYLALRAMTAFYEAGDCARAKGVSDMMEPSIAAWQTTYSDPDLEDDRTLMYDLRKNIDHHCAAIEAKPPVNFSGSCFFI